MVLLFLLNWWLFLGVMVGSCPISLNLVIIICGDEVWWGFCCYFCLVWRVVRVFWLLALVSAWWCVFDSVVRCARAVAVFVVLFVVAWYDEMIRCYLWVWFCFLWFDCVLHVLCRCLF